MSDGAMEPGGGIFRLRGGRWLSYSECGSPDGPPVMHMHGMPGSRVERFAPPETYARLGVRLITPDRPGYGESDPDPRGSLLDWAADLEELAEGLRLPRFGITSLSGGGIFALACAARFPGRLTGVVTTGCPSPLAVPGGLRGLRFANRLGLRLSRRAPFLLEWGAAGLSGVLRRYPQFFLSQMNRDKPGPDRQLLERPAVRQQAIATLREAIHHGTRGYVNDVRLLASPWGFEPSQIEAPVQLWHGRLDTVIPVWHAHRLAAEIPNAVLHLVPDQAHMLIWDHLPEVLQEAAGQSGEPGLRQLPAA